MANYALIENGVVTNIVVWDGGDSWTPPNNIVAVLLADDVVAHIGLGYEDGVFEQPPAPEVSPPTAAETYAANTATRDQLLRDASVALAPLQMAVSLGEATDEETALAKAWVTFSRAVKGIDLTESSPAWPTAPSA